MLSFRWKSGNVFPHHRRRCTAPKPENQNMKINRLFIALICAALAAFTHPVNAAPGDVDKQFNPNANGGVYIVALQPDGKIIIGGGFTAVGGVARNYLARINADGVTGRGLQSQCEQRRH